MALLQNFRTYVALPLGALLFASGLLVMVFTLTWSLQAEVDAWVFTDEKAVHMLVGIGAALSFLGAILGWIGFAALPSLIPPAGATDADRQALCLRQYHRTLIGIGYTLLLNGILIMLALAGFAYAHRLDDIFPATMELSSIDRPASMTELQPRSGQGSLTRPSQLDSSIDVGNPAPTQPAKAADGVSRAPSGTGSRIDAALAEHPVKATATTTISPSSKQGMASAALLMISLGMAILGALFFIANALREKRDDFQSYEVSTFWGGLWYRLGEAVLFTVVVFLALRRFSPGAGDYWLPILALFLGMFVTAGERLVFGIAKRTVAAVGTFLPLSASDFDDAPSVPGQVRGLQGTRAPGAAPNTVSLKWNRPSSGVVALYAVERRLTPGSGPWLSTGETVQEQLALPSEPANAEYRVVAVNQTGRGKESNSITI